MILDLDKVVLVFLQTIWLSSRIDNLKEDLPVMGLVTTNTTRLRGLLLEPTKI